jgi:hypothetical protein
VTKAVELVVSEAVISSLHHQRSGPIPVACRTARPARSRRAFTVATHVHDARRVFRGAAVGPGMDTGMTTTAPRALISAVQVTRTASSSVPRVTSTRSIPGRRFRTLPPVDACARRRHVPSYEQFWAAIRRHRRRHHAAAPPREVAYADSPPGPAPGASTTLTDTSWPTARIVRDIEIRNRSGNRAARLRG